MEQRCVNADESRCHEAQVCTRYAKRLASPEQPQAHPAASLLLRVELHLQPVPAAIWLCRAATAHNSACPKHASADAARHLRKALHAPASFTLASIITAQPPTQCL